MDIITPQEELILLKANLEKIIEDRDWWRDRAKALEIQLKKKKEEVQHLRNTYES